MLFFSLAIRTCMTGGFDRGVHVTDVTNASRTMLINIHTQQWDLKLCKYAIVSFFLSLSISIPVPRPFLSVSHYTVCIMHIIDSLEFL